MSKRIHSHFRPQRKRIQFCNELVDPFTGEITYPETRTKQSHKDECDINKIIKSFSITGQVDQMKLNAARGIYTDLVGMPDYQEALQITAQAGAAFSTLPSHVRARFDNDPARWLSFMENPANEAEIRSMGLMNNPDPPPTPQTPPPTPPKE